MPLKCYEMVVPLHALQWRSVPIPYDRIRSRHSFTYRQVSIELVEVHGLVIELQNLPSWKVV
jgi:hypothetical protein